MTLRFMRPHHFLRFCAFRGQSLKPTPEPRGGRPSSRATLSAGRSHTLEHGGGDAQASGPRNRPGSRTAAWSPEPDVACCGPAGAGPPVPCWKESSSWGEARRGAALRQVRRAYAHIRKNGSGKIFLPTISLRISASSPVSMPGGFGLENAWLREWAGKLVVGKFLARRLRCGRLSGAPLCNRVGWRALSGVVRLQWKKK